MAPAGGGALRCLDNAGVPVAWWFMYKTPGGYNFSYADPLNHASAPLTIFPRAMDDSDNPVAITRTLMALAEDPDTDGSAESPAADDAAYVPGTRPSYFLYNDQPDEGTASDSYGHTKGVVAAAPDAKSGVWIVHSTPHWPSASGKAKFYFPERETTYGQTFLCMSLDAAGLEAVGQQQRLTRPFVYHRTQLFARSNATVAATFPTLAAVLSATWDTAPSARPLDVRVGSWPLRHTFTAFAKNKEWGSDLWEELVAPHYQDGLTVESWIRGQALGPYCPPGKPYPVVDARTLYARRSNGSTVSWTATRDHAKWATTQTAAVGVVCVGDINRMTTQRDRGGGAVCFANARLWRGMRASVNTSDECGGAEEQPPRLAPRAAGQQSAA